MKIAQLIIMLVSLGFANLTLAQSKLVDSPRQSSEIHIYKLNKNDLRKVHLKDESFEEKMLNNKVADYRVGENMPTLTRGNYVKVQVIENQLNCTELVIDDLYTKIIPAEDFVICLYDSLGKIIDGAEIKKGSSKLKFDKKQQVYRTKKIKDEQIIEIENKGVYHYLEVDNYQYDYYRGNLFQSMWYTTKGLWYKTRNGVKHILYPSERPIKEKYTGFVVFNKPKYKPNEVVKLKAYLAEHKGKRYDKAIGIKLREIHYRPSIDTILAIIEPYQAGMYTYEFKLSKELDLTLDKSYEILLINHDKNSNSIGERFGYEDYELKSINFAMTSDKKEFATGDSIKIKMKVRDENDMAVYDGKVELKIFPEPFNQTQLKNTTPVFIADTLWNHIVDVSQLSEKNFIVPNSIFPKNTAIKFKINATYFSSDNEKHSQTLSLYKLASPYTFDYSLNKGMLTIKELHKGISQATMAHIKIEGVEDEVLFADSVRLPHTLPIPWLAEDIKVETANQKHYYTPEVADEQIEYRFYRNNDSIHLQIENPANIPYWYTIRNSKKEIERGYTTQLNYITKDKEGEAYSLQIVYLFGGKPKTIETSLPYAQKNLGLEVNTPSTIYPGQKTNVQVSVTDKNGKPVKDADITAYSFTSKFKNYSMPSIPIGGKSKYAKRFINTNYDMDDNLHFNAKADMTWGKWASSMGLDTIEYYKFLYPQNTYYLHKISTADGSTQISPFVVINGNIQGVQMLWIDNRLYYTSQAEHQNIYTFEVSEGKHNLQFRTYNREIQALNFVVEKGMKHIISFNASESYTRIPTTEEKGLPFVLTSKLLSAKEQGFLSKKEELEMQSQLITINNTFGTIKLPNIKHVVEIPSYMVAGKTMYYLNHQARLAYNNTLRAQVNMPILVGPFPHRSSMNGLSNIGAVYADKCLLSNFDIEGGNLYTLYPNYQKIKQWDKLPIRTRLTNFTPIVSFSEQLLTKEAIDKQVEDKIINIMHSATGLVSDKDYRKDLKGTYYRLNLLLEKDSLGKKIEPTLIFIEPKREEDRKDYQLYYGGARNFTSLPTEELSIHLIFNDSTSYSYPMKLYKDGTNYLKLDSIKYKVNSKQAKIAYGLFQKGITKDYVENPYLPNQLNIDNIILSPLFDEAQLKRENQDKNVVTGVVRDEYGDVLIGATVVVKGTSVGAVTDFDGRFEIEVDENATLEALYIGYKPKKVKVSSGYDYSVVLQEDNQSFLNEVVVIGYGVQKKHNLTGSVVTIVDNSLDVLGQQVLQGRVAGLMIRGVNSSSEAKPLLIVNGLPFDGSLDDLDVSTIRSLNVLKDAATTSIYGSQAANGVIMIETNALALQKTNADTENTANEAGNSMRRNFHDDAFWQPQLKTDAKGEVNFEVTYPDDITNWNTYFIALGGKNQTDTKQINIKSFKALSARLSTPRFAIRGDSINTVGRVANHFGDSVQVTRTIQLDDDRQTTEMKIDKSHVDYIPVKALEGDSLTLSYSLQMQNGYFDGEERSFPILEQGMLQTHGDFRVINDTLPHILKTNPDLGVVTFHAEATSLDLFLREIDYIDRYPYMCNEQMASKIKALLSKKYILELQGKPFKEDKKINSLIRDLNKNKNKEGLWGWWNKSESVMWISKHIIGALLDAEAAGYKTDLDKYSLALAFEQELKNGLADLPFVVGRKPTLAKGELLDRILFLKRLNAPIDYKKYQNEINAKLQSVSTKDNLKEMLALSVIGLQDSINIDSLMVGASKSILGSLYWANVTKEQPQTRYFYRPTETNVENTLMAYQILKNIGGHENKLKSIQNYFFEQRQNTNWNNIYESSHIVQTIMPNMIDKSNSYQDVVMYINGTKVDKFPHTQKMSVLEKVEVQKRGTLPLFVTAYQKEWNKTPKRESSKGLQVATTFKLNNDTVATLKEGSTTILQAQLNLMGDAEYVQIEVPIPAGCSYESKLVGNYWKEAHREYYKERVVIFCNKLSKGQHIFNIELLPRYTGKYTLNPAKAELMYFPLFYGNEEIKEVDIK